MSVRFKKNNKVKKILDEVMRVYVSIGNPDLEVKLNRKDFNLFLDNIIDLMPHEREGFEWQKIKVKGVG